MVVEEDSRIESEDETFSISLECMAEGMPMPTYKIKHTLSDDTEVDITASMDDRYTVIGGRYVDKNILTFCRYRSYKFVSLDSDYLPSYTMYDKRLCPTPHMLFINFTVFSFTET